MEVKAHSEWSEPCDPDLFGVSSREYENCMGATVVGQRLNSARDIVKFTRPWGFSYDERASWWGSTMFP